MKNEIWKPVVGYEGYYEVSSLGRVRGIRRRACSGKILKHVISITGYPSVTLSRHCVVKRKTVHRLVAQAFIPNPLNLPEVNHINGDKCDYSIENLEWVTSKQNSQHAVRTGLLDNAKIHGGRISEKRKRVIRNDGEVFASLHEAAEKSGTYAGNVCKVLKGLRSEAGGYTFRYADE